MIRDNKFTEECNWGIIYDDQKLDLKLSQYSINIESKDVNAYANEKTKDKHDLFNVLLGIFLQKIYNVNEVSLKEIVGGNYIYFVDICAEMKSSLDSLIKDYVSNKENFEVKKIQELNENTIIEARIDVIMWIREQNKNISFYFYFDEAKYNGALIKSIAEAFVHMINQLIVNSDKPIYQVNCNINLNRIMTEFNNTDERIPEDKTVIELFEERVMETPDDTAIIFGDEVVTFKQLNLNADNLAHKLIRLGIKEGDFIPLYTAKGVELVVGILGILKAGGVYIPVTDNSIVSNIISECAPKVILYYNKKIRGIDDIPCLEIQYKADVVNNIDSVNIHPKLDSVASCIYTSGSTGKSKGVLLTHLGFVNTVLTNIKVYELTLRDVVLQYSNYTYAQSIIDIFVGIIASKLCIISDEDYMDIYALEKICKKNNVTVMALTPSLISELNPDNFKTIRVLDSTGESAKASSLTNWANHCTVLNSYGSTELTGNTSVYKVMGNEKGIIPIGKPIFNNRYYILDRFNKMCDIGMLGELYIEGLGLAKGYLKDEKLTTTKFVRNPITGNMAFKSGDMARWLPDGSVEFVERLDSQVKIRGRRVNLNDIKVVIDKIDVINDSLVTIKIDEKGDEVICAYLISKKTIDISQVKNILINKLPSYMVPTFITQIDRIPLNKNAKVDYSVLPQITYKYIDESCPNPTTKYEKILVDLICKELKVDSVSLNSKFVEIGGDSIKAMRIVVGLRELGYKLLGSQLISDNKLSDVAKNIEIVREVAKERRKLSQANLAAVKKFYGFEKSKIKTVLTLSPLQKGILYECIDKSEKNIYINQLKIEHLYNKKCVLKTFKILGRMYPILTSNIIYDIIREPLQVVFKDKMIDFETIEIDRDGKFDQIDKIINSESKRKIDIQRDPLFRIKYLENKDGLGTLILTYHHIILDGWSMEVLVKEIIKTWQNLLNSKDVYIDESIFEDYEVYNQTITNYNNKEALYYWNSYLKGFNNSNSLPFVSVVDKENESYNFYFDELDPNIVDIMHEKSKKYNVTVSNFLESAWGILLAEYSGSKDVVFGKIISNRENFMERIDKQVGFFINTIPVRIKYDSSERFIDIIKSNRDNSLNSSKYSFCSLAQIQKKAEQREMIKTTLSIENYYNEDECNNEIIVQELSESTSCPLTINIAFIGKKTKVKITYNTGIYDGDKIFRIYNKYIHILKSMISNPELVIGSSNLLSDIEREEVLEKFNNTKVDFKNDKTFIELFEEQVERTPNNIAIVCGEQKITYSQLNNRANCVAHKLRKLGVKTNDLIPIIAKRSVEMIVGIYGILKAGAGYVPVDYKFPKDRIDYILKDCNATIILKYDVAVKTNLLEIDLGDVNLYQKLADNLEIVSGLDNYVYCIYTSGTTGNPKGVVNINRGMINLLLYMNKEYKLCKHDVILQKTPYTFDASVWEIMWWAINGASVSLLPPNGEQEPDKIYETIKNTDVTVVQFVPSMLNMFLEYIEKQANANDFSKIKYILTIGEPLNINVVRRMARFLRAKNTGLKIINVYGPTEASVFVTTYECRVDMNTIFIGKPIANTQIYIVNNRRLCGVGMVGEICIAGEALSIGYLNKKELTDAKFVNNLFGCGKMYYTGDIARWLPDGNIEIFGRMDDQVKIRGCRIELTEIENQIRNIENIKDCAVIVKEDSSGNNVIYAYVVSEVVMKEAYIKEQLAYKLPEYMVPTYIGKIESIPVTTNGKLDRSLLPELNISRTDTYVAPRTKEEIALCEIYEEILKLKKVGIKDDFFSLGGHSLLAILLINQIDLHLGVKLKVKDIFESPIVERLADKIKNKPNQERFTIPIANESNFYEASSVQKRIFLLNEMDPMSLSYNISEAIILKGRIKKTQLRTAIEELVNKYEILRTDFVNIDGELYQRIHKEIELDFGIIENDRQKDEIILKQFIKPFDLSRAPLFRIGLVEKESYCLLLIDMHHIIGDGESIKKFMKELAQGYNESI